MNKRQPAVLPACRLALPLLVGLVCLFSATTGWSLEPRVRFEVRRTTTEPRRGYLEMKVKGSDQLVHVSLDADITNRDIEQVSHGVGPGGSTVVHIRLKRRGAERLQQITQASIGQRLAILVNGEVIMAPIVRSAIRERVEVTGMSAADAQFLSETLGRRR